MAHKYICREKNVHSFQIDSAFRKSTAFYFLYFTMYIIVYCICYMLWMWKPERIKTRIPEFKYTPVKSKKLKYPGIYRRFGKIMFFFIRVLDSRFFELPGFEHPFIKILLLLSTRKKSLPLVYTIIYLDIRL